MKDYICDFKSPWGSVSFDYFYNLYSWNEDAPPFIKEIQLYSVQMVARRFTNLKSNVLRRLINDKKVEYYLIGNRVRFSLIQASEANDFLIKGKICKRESAFPLMTDYALNKRTVCMIFAHGCSINDVKFHYVLYGAQKLRCYLLSEVLLYLEAHKVNIGR